MLDDPELCRWNQLSGVRIPKADIAKVYFCPLSDCVDEEGNDPHSDGFNSQHVGTGPSNLHQHRRPISQTIQDHEPMDIGEENLQTSNLTAQAVVSRQSSFTNDLADAQLQHMQDSGPTTSLRATKERQTVAKDQGRPELSDEDLPDPSHSLTGNHIDRPLRRLPSTEYDAHTIDTDLSIGLLLDTVPSKNITSNFDEANADSINQALLGQSLKGQVFSNNITTDQNTSLYYKTHSPISKDSIPVPPPRASKSVVNVGTPQSIENLYPSVPDRQHLGSTGLVHSPSNSIKERTGSLRNQHNQGISKSNEDPHNGSSKPSINITIETRIAHTTPELRRPDHGYCK